MRYACIGYNLSMRIPIGYQWTAKPLDGLFKNNMQHLAKNSDKVFGFEIMRKIGLGWNMATCAKCSFLVFSDSLCWADELSSRMRIQRWLCFCLEVETMHLPVVVVVVPPILYFIALIVFFWKLAMYTYRFRFLRVTSWRHLCAMTDSTSLENKQLFQTVHLGPEKVQYVFCYCPLSG